MYLCVKNGLYIIVHRLTVDAEFCDSINFRCCLRDSHIKSVEADYSLQEITVSLHSKES